MGTCSGNAVRQSLPAVAYIRAGERTTTVAEEPPSARRARRCLGRVLVQATPRTGLRPPRLAGPRRRRPPRCRCRPTRRASEAVRRERPVAVRAADATSDERGLQPVPADSRYHDTTLLSTRSQRPTPPERRAGRLGLFASSRPGTAPSTEEGPSAHVGGGVAPRGTLAQRDRAGAPSRGCAAFAHCDLDAGRGGGARP